LREERRDKTEELEQMGEGGKKKANGPGVKGSPLNYKKRWLLKRAETEKGNLGSAV